MANYCSNSLYITRATINGTKRFYNQMENEALEIGNQWIFDINDIEDHIVHIIYFTTKWSTHESTIEALITLLEAESGYCYYDEPGNGVAGKIICNSEGTFYPKWTEVSAFLATGLVGVTRKYKIKLKDL